MDAEDATEAQPDLDALVAELRERMLHQSRLMLGIAGAPGAGKSTFAEHLVGRLDPGEAVIVPMDGFHLGNAILDGTERAARKGAPDTFDVGGYLTLLKRLRDQTEDVVYAPAYRRGLEEPIAASIAVPRSIPLIVTEGNYLLADLPRWREVPRLLDDVWFVDVPDAIRVPQLIARHIAFGMTPGAAERWANGPDAANAALVAATRGRAGRVIRWS